MLKQIIRTAIVGGKMPIHALFVTTLARNTGSYEPLLAICTFCVLWIGDQVGHLALKENDAPLPAEQATQCAMHQSLETWNTISGRNRGVMDIDQCQKTSVFIAGNENACYCFEESLRNFTSSSATNLWQRTRHDRSLRVDCVTELRYSDKKRFSSSTEACAPTMTVCMHTFTILERRSREEGWA